MRKGTRIVAMLAGLALAVALAFPASADPGHNNRNADDSSPPGNNGTIKIHAGDKESEPIVANEPHPGCTFHIHGFNLDSGSSGTWSIVAWPPTGDGSTVVASGKWSASASGEWRTAVMSLASGHYKAFAKQTGSPGGDKQKVFWVECGATAPTSIPTSAGATSTPTTAAETPTPSTAAATATPSPTQLGFEQAPMGGVGRVVETGAPSAVQGFQQAPGQAPAVAGQQQPAAPAAVSGLPSTSTVPAGAPLGALALIGPLAALLWRRIRR